MDLSPGTGRPIERQRSKLDVKRSRGRRVVEPYIIDDTEGLLSKNSGPGWPARPPLS